MARRYEYIIHGPPLPPAVQTIPRKALHSRRDSQKTTNLRFLYHNPAPPNHTQKIETTEPSQQVRKSTPTTPKLPPTPPVIDGQDEVVQEQSAVHEIEAERLQSMRASPINQNSPPTPEDTPPRNTLKAALRPSLAIKPSFASTRAESFKTAHEHIHSDDDFGRSTLTLHSAVASQEPISELPWSAELDNQNDQDDQHAHLPENEPDSASQRDSLTHLDRFDGDITPPAMPSTADDEFATHDVAKDTPETQFRFEHLKDDAAPLFVEPVSIEDNGPHQAHADISRLPSVHELVTTSPAEDPLKRGKSLRDRLNEKNQIPITESTEAFAHIIGWNDGAHSVAQTDCENRSNRWSGNSNPSAVEAYVIESPIKPQKRGTLRKVIKNDSLRAVSSPIPDSKRASLQSNSDSSHRLVHKKAKLTNQNRWSTGSDISRRSLSLNSPTPWPKTEIITVAIIPEKGDFLHTSAGSSRRHSRSISTSSGHDGAVMPPISTPVPRRKRAFSDSIERTPVNDHPVPSPARRNSSSTPTSMNASRVNSVSSEHVSMQRQQAEKDLRSTLDRMESERLSSSLRRVSLHSSSPTPSAKPVKNPPEEPIQKPSDAPLPRRISSTGASTWSGPRYSNVGINGITPGTKEWAELRPPTVSGTPFSQTSMASASPEIIEAKVVSFFPHHNESLQIIEPNRLSESQAVRALRDQPLGRSNTVPAMKISTPRTSDRIVQSDVIDSPLRNPRKPPDPPQFEITPATPLSELSRHLATTPDPNSTMSRTPTVVRERPALEGPNRSESFMKNLTRNFSTRNAKNPKADQELDGTQHPFWRPRAFWDDTEQRPHQQKSQDSAIGTLEDTTMPTGETMRTVTILDRPIKRRSNTITTGPVSLVRKISERKRQRKLVDDHLVQQQALVKQTSYSSLHKFRVGRRMYGMPPIRALSLNVNMGRLRGLQDKVVTARAKREDSKREKKREALRKSIGAEVVSQGDSRFVNQATTKVYDPTEEMLQNARSQELLQKMQEREGGEVVR